MSTASHFERPLHFIQRGKLASLSSKTSSPQHSDAYSPGSITSCPVFIPLPRSTPVILCLTSLHTEVLCIAMPWCRIVCRDENPNQAWKCCYGCGFVCRGHFD